MQGPVQVPDPQQDLKPVACRSLAEQSAVRLACTTQMGCCPQSLSPSKSLRQQSASLVVLASVTDPSEGCGLPAASVLDIQGDARPQAPSSSSFWAGKAWAVHAMGQQSPRMPGQGAIAKKMQA